MIRIYKAGLHYGEEKGIAGNECAGMIVFSGCMLSCEFCYTPETSRYNLGQDYSESEFLDLLVELVQKGAKNINLITPSHLWKKIECSLVKFKIKMEMSIPIVLKIGGSEPIWLLKKMSEIADVFVIDFKVWSPELACQTDLPSQYGRRTISGVDFLFKNFEMNSLKKIIPIRNGIVIWHLLMPEFEEDSMEILKQLEGIGYSGPINLMTTYVDPKTNRIYHTPPHFLKRLIQLAQDLSLGVWIDGKMRNTETRELVYV